MLCSQVPDLFWQLVVFSFRLGKVHEPSEACELHLALEMVLCRAPMFAASSWQNKNIRSSLVSGSFCCLFRVRNHFNPCFSRFGVVGRVLALPSCTGCSTCSSCSAAPNTARPGGEMSEAGFLPQAVRQRHQSSCKACFFLHLPAAVLVLDRARAVPLVAP